MELYRIEFESPEQEAKANAIFDKLNQLYGNTARAWMDIFHHDFTGEPEEHYFFRDEARTVQILGIVGLDKFLDYLENNQIPERIRNLKSRREDICRELYWAKKKIM